jgi:hypothetical protein
LSKAQTFSPQPLRKHLNTKSSNFSKAENSPTPIEATQYKKLKFCPKLKTQYSKILPTPTEEAPQQSSKLLPTLDEESPQDKKKLKFVKNSKLLPHAH